jgi:hypothetical protein
MSLSGTEKDGWGKVRDHHGASKKTGARSLIKRGWGAIMRTNPKNFRHGKLFGAARPRADFRPDITDITEITDTTDMPDIPDMPDQQ